MGCRIYGNVGKTSVYFTRDRVYLRNAVDLVPEQLHAVCVSVGIGGEYFYNVPTDTEIISVKADIRP